MAFIGLGNIDKKIIPIIIASISCFLNRLLNKVDAKLYKNTIMTNICISSSKIFALIPFFILKKRTKSVTSTDIELSSSSSISTKHTRKYIYVNGEKRILKGIWKFVFISAVIFTINQVLYVVTLSVKTNTTTLDIVFTSIFYYLFLKVRLYRHHYLSMILIIISGASIDLFLGNLQLDFGSQIGTFFLRVLRESMYSLSSVVDNYIMEKKFISEYTILLVDGISCVILFLIFVIFDYNYIGIDKYDDYFSNFSGIEVFMIIATIVTQFFLNLFLLITNKINSPCHCFIVFVFGYMANYVDFSEKSTIVICGTLVILLFALIFNEIIELNFCGLSYNTKRNIMLRAEKDKEENYDLNRSDTNDSTNEINGYIVMVDKNPKPEESNEEEDI